MICEQQELKHASCKPVIKWSGSKRSQSSEIIKSFPKQINTYYEPFVGGGSIVYELLKQNHSIKKIVCSDNNRDLFSLWINIMEDPEFIIMSYKEMWEHLNNYNDSDLRNEYFYKIRERFNKERNVEDFFFLLRTCTNGLVRYNKKNEFNTSFHFSRPGIRPETISKIIFEWSQLLNKNQVEFLCQDYKNIKPEKGDFVYMDPPYAKTKGLYNGVIDLSEFWAWMKELKCGYAFSFDGKSGNNDMTYNVPKELYDEHFYIKSGNSSFKRIKTLKKEMVHESLYVKYN